MITKTNPEEFIKNMPKVELHLHLEGAFTIESLFDLINKYGGVSGISNVGSLEEKFQFRDFSHFIETWCWKNDFFREAEDFEYTIYHTMKNLHEQSIVYVEAFYSPWDFAPSGISAPAITEAIIEAVKKAKTDFGICCQLIADISRDVGADSSVERFRQVLPYRNEGIIGIGLGGSEQKFPNELFADVFKEAKKEGLHLVAHAGEAAGPESVWSALEVLEAERIGHGVRAIEDPILMKKLKTDQVPMEICVNSNLKTGIFLSLEKHPVKSFFNEGLNITINSDDPTMFGKTLTDEFIYLHQRDVFSLHDLKTITLNAVNASFLNDEQKKSLGDKVEDYWTRNNV